MDNKEFIEAVIVMRRRQKDYFRYRTQGHLTIAKEAEAKVDAMIEGYEIAHNTLFGNE